MTKRKSKRQRMRIHSQKEHKLEAIIVIQKWIRDQFHRRELNRELNRQYHLCTEGQKDLASAYSDIHNHNLDFDDNLSYLRYIPEIALAVDYGYYGIIERLYKEAYHFSKERLQQLLISAIELNQIDCARVLLNIGAQAKINNYDINNFNSKLIDEFVLEKNYPINNFEINQPLFLSNSEEMTNLLIEYGADPSEYLIRLDEKANLPKMSNEGLIRLAQKYYGYAWDDANATERQKYIDEIKVDLETYDSGVYIKTKLSAIDYAIRKRKPEIAMALIGHLKRPLASFWMFLFGQSSKEITRLGDPNRIIAQYLGLSSLSRFKKDFDPTPLYKEIAFNSFKNIDIKVFMNPETGFTCMWKTLYKKYGTNNQKLYVYNSHNTEFYNYANVTSKDRTYNKHLGKFIDEIPDNNQSYLAAKNMRGNDEWQFKSFISSSRSSQMGLEDSIKIKETDNSITIYHEEDTWPEFRDKWREKGICVRSIKDIFGTYIWYNENHLEHLSLVLKNFMNA